MFCKIFRIPNKRMPRYILAQAWGIFISLIAAMLMALADTVILGHFNTLDLAAVAIGSGAFIVVEFTLFGVLQAVAPLSAELYGAGHKRAAALMLQQAVWLTFLVFIPGVLLLIYPDWFLKLSTMPTEIDEKARLYLKILAFGLPAALLYRTFYAFCSALGLVKVLLRIGLIALILHIFLASFLALKGFNEPLGLLGCAISNVILNYLMLVLAAFWALKSRDAKHLQIFGKWYLPNKKRWLRLLKVGLPMGMTNCIESSAFVLVSILLAPLGAEAVGAYRVLGGLASILYIIPLSIAVAVMAETAQALGAKDQTRLLSASRTGLGLSTSIAALSAASIFLFGKFYVQLNTNNALIIAIATPLLVFIAAYQLFDSIQTVMMHLLRACKITVFPMLIQIVLFWGVGLFGGWWLCYKTGLKTEGFLIALDAALVLLAIILSALWKKISTSLLASFPK